MGTWGLSPPFFVWLVNPIPIRGTDYAYLIQPSFLEKWFCKLGFFLRLEKSDSANPDFFSGSRKRVDQKRRLVYTINPPFIRLDKNDFANSDLFSGTRKVCRTTLHQHHSKNMERRSWTPTCNYSGGCQINC